MSRRNQICLNDEQLARIDLLAKRRHITRDEVVSRAIDAYLDTVDDLDASFGKAIGIAESVHSRDEWDRG